MSSLGDLYGHLKTLCEQWFYNKSISDSRFSAIGHTHDASDLTDNSNTAFKPKSHEHGNISNDGKVGTNANYFVYTGTGGLVSAKQKVGNITTGGAIGSTANLPIITTSNGVLTTGAFGSSTSTSATQFVSCADARLSDARTPTSHNQASSTITDSTTYANIGNTAQTQASINSAINTKLGELSSVEVIKVVANKGTASASTMNKLFIEVGSESTDVWYTKQSGNTYTWAKMDSDILDDLSISWNDITGKPSLDIVYDMNGSSNDSIHITYDDDGNSVYVPLGGFLADKIGGIESDIYNINNSLDDKSDYDHGHGQITSDGKIGSNANYFVYTTTGGEVTSKQKIGNINTSGQISTTGTNGGKLVVTNSSNTMVVQTSIDVLDGVVQDLITYGSS